MTAIIPTFDIRHTFAPLMRNINGNFLYMPIEVWGGYGTTYPVLGICGAIPKDKPLFETIKE